MPLTKAGPVGPADKPPFVPDAVPAFERTDSTGRWDLARLHRTGRRLTQISLVALATAAFILAYRSGDSSGVGDQSTRRLASAALPDGFDNDDVEAAEAYDGLPERAVDQTDSRSGTGTVVVTDASVEHREEPDTPEAPLPTRAATSPTLRTVQTVQTSTEATAMPTRPVTTTTEGSPTTSSTVVAADEVVAVAVTDGRSPTNPDEPPTVTSTTSTTSPEPPTGPTARPDRASTEEDAVTVDVLANDAAGDVAMVRSTLRIVAGPSHARSVAVTADHRIRYSPREWEGTDRLTYEICDSNGLCDQATVTIEVTDD